MASDIKLIVEAILHDKNFKDGIKGIKSSTDSASKSLGGIKSLLLGGLGIGSAVAAFNTLKNGIIGAIKVNKEFEQAIANVESVSGVARKTLEGLARAAGENTVFSAREAADALYLLASAGLDADEMAKTLEPTLNLAAAAQIGIAEATDLVVGQLKIFQRQGLQVEEATDILAKTVQSSNTNMQQLGSALSYAASTAATVGIEFEDLNVIIASLADLGINGERAGTQLRQALTRLIKPTSGAEEALAKYGISTEEVTKLLPKPIELFKRLNEANLSNADALEIFGVRQADIINLIKNGTQYIDKNVKAISNAGGAAERAAKTQINTLEGQLKLLNSAWEELILILTGDSGAGNALKDIVTNIKDVVISINNFIKSSEGIRTFAVSWAILKATISAVYNGTIKPVFEGIKILVTATIDQFKGFGELIEAILKGNFEDLGKIASETFKKIGKDITDGAKEITNGNIQLKNDIVAIYDALFGEIDKKQKENIKGQKKNEQTITDNVKNEIEERKDSYDNFEDYKKEVGKQSDLEVIIRANESREVLADLLAQGKLDHDAYTEAVIENEKRIADAKIAFSQFAAQKISDLYSSISNAILRVSQLEISEVEKVNKEKIKEIEDTRDAQVKILDEQYEQGLIDEETYRKGIASINEHYADVIADKEKELKKEEVKLKRKAIKAEAAVKSAQVGINAALAIIAAYAEGWEIGTAVTPLINTAAGASIGVITREAEAALNALPAYARGGIVPDDSLAFINRQEMVLPVELSNFIRQAASAQSQQNTNNDNRQYNETINFEGTQITREMTIDEVLKAQQERYDNMDARQYSRML